MTGISEILFLLLLICGLLILPRMIKPAPKTQAVRKPKNLSLAMRAGIVVSILIPAVLALILKPWQGEVLVFISLGVLPVAAGWGLFWILSARRN